MQTLIAAAWVLAASAAIAQDGGIISKAINQPGVSYVLYGPGQTSRMVKDKDVAGGQALRVTVSRGAQAYTVGASAPLTKPIVKGHRIVVAFWARAPRLAGDATTPIPFFGLIGPAPAYAPVVTGSADVGAAWKLHDARGTAASDLAVGPGGAAVALHLSAASATIDLGPVFVIDLDSKG